uniref:Uncharacterized protein n=1 Tax=Anguilla anguilla TaxID=7936 RepID=A0A0E9TFV1_ANGAN
MGYSLRIVLMFFFLILKKFHLIRH